MLFPATETFISHPVYGDESDHDSAEEGSSTEEKDRNIPV
jgi:hypothetical protein